MKNRRRKKGRKKPAHSRSWEARDERAQQRAIEADRREHERLLELKAAAARHLDIHDLHLSQQDGGEAIWFFHGKQKVAFLFPNELVTPTRTKVVPGDFLAPGDHWYRAHGVLLELQEGRSLQRAAFTPSPFSSTLTEFPAGLPGDLRTAAGIASSRIRTKRNRAFGHPVVLDADGFEIRFDPIRSHPETKELPFRVCKPDSAPVEGALRVLTPADPLEVAFASGSEAEIVQAWIIALLAFADLSCVVDPRLIAQAGTGGRPGVGGGSARSRSSTERSPAIVPGRRDQHARRVALSKNLTAVGETAKHGASLVVGHRRRLHGGQSCHEDARAAARAFGIELAEDETWVQPHVRGLPDDAVFHFRWQAPPELLRMEAGTLAIY